MCLRRVRVDVLEVKGDDLRADDQKFITTVLRNT